MKRLQWAQGWAGLQTAGRSPRSAYRQLWDHRKFPKTDIHKSLPFPLYVYYEERSSPSYRWRLGGRSDDIWIWQFTVSGCGKFRYGKKSRSLPPGTAFLVNSNDDRARYWYPGKGDEPWCFFWIDFVGGEHLTRAIIEEHGHVIELPGHASPIHHLQFMRKTDFPRLFPPEKVVGLLLELLSSYLVKTGSGPSGEEGVLGRVWEYLDRTGVGRASVEGMAGSMNITREHLSRLFQKEIRITPRKYLAQLRHSLACELLRCSRESISVISHELGYANCSNFTRVFRQVEGVTPSEFRSSQVAFSEPWTQTYRKRKDGTYYPYPKIDSSRKG